MECAKNVLISAACFRHKAVFRFAFLRSDLFCHHMKSTLATYQFLNVPGVILLRSSHTDVICFVGALVGKYGPGNSRHLVRKSHGYYVARSPLSNSFLPGSWYLGVT